MNSSLITQQKLSLSQNRLSLFNRHFELIFLLVDDDAFWNYMTAIKLIQNKWTILRKKIFYEM